jgi:hypothetical protein
MTPVSRILADQIRYHPDESEKGLPTPFVSPPAFVDFGKIDGCCHAFFAWFGPPHILQETECEDELVICSRNDDVVLVCNRTSYKC